MLKAENLLNLVPLPIDPRRKFLVTGGNGFIGSHVAKALFKRVAFVRVADVAPSSAFEDPICDDMLVGNLCDEQFCDRAVKGIDTVLHFAATMGGMGTIHRGNDLTIYQINSRITSNILIASIRAKVRVFFYASSACVYPAHKQDNLDVDVSLKEEDVWGGGTPEPQGHYGLEKLVSELLIQQSAYDIRVQIARFHNVFGPRGAWNGGREKAPAAMLRKALAIRLAGRGTNELEIWGDGRQRRSFLFISDCVEAILALVASGYDKPVNIGSDRAVPINELAAIAVRCAGLQPGEVVIRSNTDAKTVGVRARNSNNHLVEKVLSGWTPKVSLEDGMTQTGEWIKGEMEKTVDGRDEEERVSTLQMMRRSKIVDLADKDIKVAILLPITSRGSNPPSRCLSLLETFAESLARTTWRDTRQLGGQRFVVKVYLAIDHDDPLLLRSDDKTDMNVAEAVLASQNICDVAIQICNHPPGHVCAIWRQVAKKAWEDGCDYFVLMGDDVVLKDEGWIRDAHAEFAEIAHRAGAPHGLGCVAFTDTSFPGMPTFPIIHRTHLNIFDGDVIPEIFINQDGDPFLYQLYRRWDCSRMFSARISNGIGGSQPARYRQEHAKGWTFGPLDKATATTGEWLLRHCPAVSRKLTLDVVVPSFRVQLQFLEPILKLKPSPTCTTMFIIIIDDPNSPARIGLETQFASRPDVRIRTNDKNLGASASRNRGMRESAAEWIFFLDDDITPRPDLLVEAEKVIRANPNAVGFIGNAQFPPADSVFTTAVHLAGVTYFWDIATKMPNETDMPWGVTANLVARRNEDGVEFNLQFPKTGGGEDIDFCRRKRDLWFPVARQGFYPAPDVVVTHPWWNDGKRSYRRFYMWSKGDGGLIRLYPDLTYIDHAPNSGELLLISCALASAGVPIFLLTGNAFPSVLALHLASMTIVGNVVHDMYRYLWRDAHRAAAIHSTLAGPKWVVAVMESALIRMATEWGRVVGMLERGEIGILGRRFDWFTNRAGDGPRNEERMNSRQRVAVIIVLLAVMLHTFHQ
ncbi:glycosyltransferase family 2 protein [Imleria badia]|nr:glycosyltransferase family 2 protein [Imleria badia]